MLHLAASKRQCVLPQTVQVTEKREQEEEAFVLLRR
jgi:hypothetical protein